ncbi:MAG: hypothetical protein GXZ14_06645, partial [Ruminococcaceae bacterium]|nr:hypothetical protein [Oscillospiraceae bacterium]
PVQPVQQIPQQRAMPVQQPAAQPAPQQVQPAPQPVQSDDDDDSYYNQILGLLSNRGN